MLIIRKSVLPRIVIGWSHTYFGSYGDVDGVRTILSLVMVWLITIIKFYPGAYDGGCRLMIIIKDCCYLVV